MGRIPAATAKAYLHCGVTSFAKHHHETPAQSSVLRMMKQMWKIFRDTVV